MPLFRQHHTLEGGLFDCSASACAAAPAAPDYSGIAASNEASAKYAYDAATNDLNFRKQVYSDQLPAQQRLSDLASQVAQQQLGASQQQQDFSKSQQDYYTSAYKPIEAQQTLQSQGGLDMSDADLQATAQRLGMSPADVAQMQTNKNAMEGAAQQGITQANAASNSAYGQGLRQLTRMGGDPNKLASAAASLASNQTLAGANAANQARQQAKGQLISQTAGDAAFGRNMPNTANQTAGVATNSGNSAVANQNTGFMSALPYAQYQSGAVSNQLGAAGIAQQGALGLGGLMNQTYGSQLGYAASMNNAMMSQQHSGLAGLGSLIGAGAQLYTAMNGIPTPSDRRLKTDITLVGRDEKTGLKIYEFSYKGDPQGRRYHGVMADEVESAYPDAVVYDDLGFASVNYGMLGIPFKEV